MGNKNENVLMGLKTGMKNSRNLLMGMKIKMQKLAVGTENIQHLNIIKNECFQSHGNN